MLNYMKLLKLKRRKAKSTCHGKPVRYVIICTECGGECGEWEWVIDRKGGDRL